MGAVAGALFGLAWMSAAMASSGPARSALWARIVVLVAVVVFSHSTD